jgi:cobalt-zinc-cadmium efflux system membrane fusion protein
MKSPIFLIASILLLVACSSKNESEQSVEPSKEELTVILSPAQMKNVGIETGKLEQREISSILKVNGKIDCLDFANIDYLSPKGELVVLYKTLFV